MACWRDAGVQKKFQMAAKMRSWALSFACKYRYIILNVAACDSNMAINLSFKSSLWNKNSKIFFSHSVPFMCEAVPPPLVALEHGMYGLLWVTRVYVSKHYDHIYSIYVNIRNFCPYEFFQKCFVVMLWCNIWAYYPFHTFFLLYMITVLPHIYIQTKNARDNFFIFMLSWFV